MLIDGMQRCSGGGVGKVNYRGLQGKICRTYDQNAKLGLSLIYPDPCPYKSKNYLFWAMYRCIPNTVQIRGYMYFIRIS